MTALNSKLSQIALTFIAVFAFTACGGGCKSGDAKDSLSKTIKESLSKKHPQFAEQIAKIKVSFEKITTTNESKDGKSASCAVEQIRLKYDTGDTIFYSNDKSRFTYSVRKGEKGISVSTNIGSKIDDMQKDLLAYYTGLGVLINGTRKGACNGIYQEKDKNGEIAVEGNCVGGLRDGVWKWFDNGFLVKETPYKSGLKNGEEKGYHKNGTITKTANYTDDKLNGAAKSYDREGYIEIFIPFKNGVVDGKMFISDMSGKAESLKPLGIKNIPNWNKDLGVEFLGSMLGLNLSAVMDYFNYLEISNGVFVVGRAYENASRIKEKDEQSLFARLDKMPPDKYEAIVIDRLALHQQSLFYKNGENVSVICQQRGKCEEVFKELIDKSFYKNQIYAKLSGKEYVEPTNSTQNSAQTAQPNEQDSQSVESNETPSAQNADEAKASTNEQSPASEQVKPSFDCAKASTNAEKLVCSDNELANLDNELSKAYANARNLLDNAGKKQLTSEQKAWLETHNQCADKECVKQSLQKRIEALKGV